MAEEGTPHRRHQPGQHLHTGILGIVAYHSEPLEHNGPTTDKNKRGCASDATSFVVFIRRDYEFQAIQALLPVLPRKPATDGFVVAAQAEDAEDNGNAEEGDRGGPRRSAERLLTYHQPMDIEIDKGIVDGIEGIGETSEEGDRRAEAAGNHAAGSEPYNCGEGQADYKALVEGIENGYAGEG